LFHTPCDFQLDFSNSRIFEVHYTHTIEAEVYVVDVQKTSILMMVTFGIGISDNSMIVKKSRN
jgi:hypothetical protein